jgi:pilus assembly protein Flp/PilA
MDKAAERSFFQRRAAMKLLFSRLVREEEGQDLIEYALLAAFIALACIAAMGLVGNGINTLFTKVNTDLTNAAK